MVRIRDAHPDDLPDLREMAEEAGLTIPDEHGVLLVADTGGPVGWLEGITDGVVPGAPVPPPHGYIRQVFVHPVARRMGVGRALVKKFVERADAGWCRGVFAAPDESPGVEGRVAWLAECGFVPVDAPGEEWPVMGYRLRWDTEGPARG